MIKTKSEKIISFLCIVLICISIAVTLTYWFVSPKNSRMVLFFPSYDSRNLCTEVRFLPKKPIQGIERLFVEELLLGPMTNRYKQIFPRNTELNYCFLKDNVLYVGLNDSVLEGVDGIPIKESIDILKFNIVKNFTFINKIDVSIDGISIY
ncbi:MAG: GerMN domain-containing protein [Treponema sp.]|nr:GerMN domain-containing protein [Treponema sp.]